MIVTFFLLLDERRVVVVAVFALDGAEARPVDVLVFGAISPSKTLTARRQSVGKRSAVVAIETYSSATVTLGGENR